MIKKQVKDNTSGSEYKIFIWDHDVNNMDELQELTYNQLTSKYIPRQTLSSKSVFKYYWDEQLIEFENDKIKDEVGHDFTISEGLFSIVLDKKVVYHGLNKTGDLSAIKFIYDDKGYPALVHLGSMNPKKTILAIQPKYSPLPKILRDYPEIEQKRLLNQEVFKHFEKQGKIVRGKIDLRNLLKNYYKLREYEVIKMKHP
jgi:hypothetical protein